MGPWRHPGTAARTAGAGQLHQPLHPLSRDEGAAPAKGSEPQGEVTSVTAADTAAKEKTESPDSVSVPLGEPAS